MIFLCTYNLYTMLHVRTTGLVLVAISISVLATNKPAVQSYNTVTSGGVLQTAVSLDGQAVLTAKTISASAVVVNNTELLSAYLALKANFDALNNTLYQLKQQIAAPNTRDQFDAALFSPQIIMSHTFLVVARRG